MVGFTISVDAKSAVTTNVWSCRAPDGSRSTGQRFAFVDKDATWTAAAGKMNSIDSTIVVTGVVGDTGTVSINGRSESVFFLRKVRMRLPSEAPAARD
jgi:hypothetical protein